MAAVPSLIRQMTGAGRQGADMVMTGPPPPPRPPRQDHALRDCSCHLRSARPQRQMGGDGTDSVRRQASSSYPGPMEKLISASSLLGLQAVGHAPGSQSVGSLGVPFTAHTGACLLRGCTVMLMPDCGPGAACHRCSLARVVLGLGLGSDLGSGQGRFSQGCSKGRCRLSPIILVMNCGLCHTHAPAHVPARCLW